MLMSRNLLKSVLVMCLAVCSSVVALANDIVYGLIPSYTYGAQTTSFDLDAVNASAATKVSPEFAFSSATDVKCGVSAGDKYYAFVNILDPATYDETVAFVTLNFTTGNMVVVNDFSYTYSKPGYNVSGMTYDANSGTLYAIEIGFGDNDQYVTNLYSVSPDDGSMTLVTTWDGQYQAIASDRNGGFYLLQNVTSDMSVYPTLYKVSPMFAVTRAVDNSTLSTGWSSYNSMLASADGNRVYLVANKKVIEFDVAAGTASLKGELSANVAAIAADKSSADGTPADQPNTPKKQARFLVETKIYGSSMGDVPDDVDSKREFYYYNTDGKQVGSACYGRNYSGSGMTDDFSVIDINKSVFDDNGNVVAMDAYQWGTYDFDDGAWKKTANSKTYTYDENGRLATDSTSYDYRVYTYNDNGTLATKSTYYRSTKQLSQTITYSNYDDNGNPWHYSSTGAYDSYKYEADMNYDDDGNKIEELRYTMVDDPDFPGETTAKYKQVEEWSYEGGILRQHIKYTFNENGEAEPESKTDYTPVDGNVNEIEVADSSYYNGKWYSSNLVKHNIYADFSDMADMTAVDAVVESDADMANTASIRFTVPQLAMSQDCRMVVYRDCLPIDTLNIFDEGVYDDETGSCVYKDKYLKNGTYSYFLQPIFAPTSEGPLAADADEVADEWTGYFASTPIDISFNTELPAVSNLALVGGRKEVTGTITNLQTLYYADLKWDNPDDADKYGFIKNSVYFVGAGVSEIDTTDIAANEASVMLYDEDAQAYVVTSYQLGKAVSDTIDIKIADIDRLAAVEAVVADGGVTFSDGSVSIDQDSNVSVFATTGQKVLAASNTRSVSLGQLAPATYIICVERGGSVKAYKYTVK